MSVYDSKKDNFCFICGYHVTDGAHIMSRGAGGSDEEHNIIRFCRKHHSEQHFIGWPEFIRRYNLQDEMISRGFEYCELRGKWFLPK